MSAAENKIKDDLKQAMIAKNAEIVSVLRMLISALRNKEITLRKGEAAELTDDQVMEVVKSEIKKRKDAAETYRTGNRPELAEKEESEVKILEKYLPEQMSDEDLEKIVREVIAGMGAVTQADFGKVMGQVMAKAKGMADGNKVSAMVKKVLSE